MDNTLEELFEKFLEELFKEFQAEIKNLCNTENCLCPVLHSTKKAQECVERVAKDNEGRHVPLVVNSEHLKDAKRDAKLTHQIVRNLPCAMEYPKQ
jgi:rRNA-processing protein FCF1